VERKEVKECQEIRRNRKKEVKEKRQQSWHVTCVVIKIKDAEVKREVSFLALGRFTAVVPVTYDFANTVDETRGSFE